MHQMSSSLAIRFAARGRGLTMAMTAVDVLIYTRHKGDNYWTPSRFRTRGW
ncbi:hypothetical protein [Arthrobacter sp. Soil736]|uniref:hypothetical protein n=1 Tax=Arthrobacter sp. Soil736 TaxID=1736395 RepID=UPI0012FC3A76|nr:hypothetical protein [Arthrobacter sp. Soil736]